MERRPQGQRRVLVSPWLFVVLLFGLITSTVFIVATVQVQDPIARTVALAAIATLGVIVASLLGETILLLDAEGFRTLWHRRTPWRTVAGVRVAEAPEWGMGTTAVVVDIVRGERLEPRVLKGFGRLGTLVDLAALRDRLDAARLAATGASGRAEPDPGAPGGHESEPDAAGDAEPGADTQH
ncbi:MAG: hypothetical protein L0G22_08610 [Propionibacteriaceae bacterium]|nr:hypothetical protein [Propionibacteriaceae bacterium]